jgi:glutamine synthetase
MFRKIGNWLKPPPPSERQESALVTPAAPVDEAAPLLDSGASPNDIPTPIEAEGEAALPPATAVTETNTPASVTPGHAADGRPSTSVSPSNLTLVQQEENPSMTKYKLEYIWLDGYTPVPNLRGKTQIKEYDSFPTLEQLPLWGFDGSSTLQADGSSSDCVLKPVALYPDPARKNGALVMCEVMMPDGVTPHESNKRATILDDPDAWFGFEQEYFFYKDGRPLGFPAAGYPEPQGKYYTGVGFSAVGDVARQIVEEHLDLCLEAGINHEGINAEVAKGQWEFQVFGKGSRTAADQMWIARYLLQRLGERYGVDIEYHCKPLGATDWNGSGMHANFSTKYMREIGGKEYFEALMGAFEKNLHDHIAVYGPDNHMRLTGLHETAPWDKFSYGVADRGASIRVPHSFVNNGYKGYLEDRRPNSQGDPYQIASQILKTISEVSTASAAVA